VNLDQLAKAFKAEADVSPETLATARLLRNSANPIKILGRGEVKVALKVRVHRISAAAKAKIEAVGGSVQTVEWIRQQGESS
jgi:large subunit ribosomal protein L15